MPLSTKFTTSANSGFKGGNTRSDRKIGGAVFEATASEGITTGALVEYA
jgi:hypothetical protein